MFSVHSLNLTGLVCLNRKDSLTLLYFLSVNKPVSDVFVPFMAKCKGATRKIRTFIRAVFSKAVNNYWIFI